MLSIINTDIIYYRKKSSFKTNVTFTFFSLTQSALVVKQHQPKEIDFPKNSKGICFQGSYDGELDAALCYPCILAHKNKISVSLWQHDAFVTKGFQNWGKKYYTVKKDKPGAFEIRQHKAIRQQFYASSRYHQKNTAKFPKCKQSGNRQVLLAILENTQILG